MTGGGSGGHITPLLSLAHELKQLDSNCEIVYIGHKGDRFDSLQTSSADFDFMSFIDSGKFRRYHSESLLSHLLDWRTIVLNIRDFFKVIASIGSAIKILRKVHPDVVFSKGGFVVVPVGIAAKLLRIPIVTHDSDSVPGLANRIVGRWAVVNATGMPARYYHYPKNKIKYVGVPVSSPDIKSVGATSLAKFKTAIKLPAASQVLLVAGGGNGSKKLNDLTTLVAPHLMKSNLALHIIHFSGSAHEQAVKKAYEDLLDPTELKRVKVFGFSSDFYKYQAAADLIFSRAGATSLAEYALFNKACIIIPSPFLTGGHQLKNAEELSAHDAAVVLPEETEPDELLAVINELLSDDHRRFQLAKNLAKLAKPNAAKDLAVVIANVAKKGKV